MGEDVRVRTVKIWNEENTTRLSNAWVSYIDSQGTIQKNSSLGNMTGKSVFQDKEHNYTGPTWGTIISGDYFYNQFIPEGSGELQAKNLVEAQKACDSEVICTGVELVLIYTLRRGKTLTDSINQISWLKIQPSVPVLMCDQLLQHFHRNDEELSIQGKWQGGTVTGVCRGWGTSKVRSTVLVWLDWTTIQRSTLIFQCSFFI